MIMKELTPLEAGDKGGGVTLFKKYNTIMMIMKELTPLGAGDRGGG